MENGLSGEQIERLENELKNLDGSVLLALTKGKRDLMQEMAATMPTYDNKSMAEREFYRGVVNGLDWLLKDVYTFMEQNKKLLQKEKK
jgi:hypothetical protein